MAYLTIEQIARDNPQNPAAVITLDLSLRGLAEVSCLSVFTSLEKLDLRNNCLTTLEGLSSCSSLKWLSVVENKLVSLKGIEGLSKLTVLNAGKNKLKTIDGITFPTSLQALILNDNNISSICKLHQLKFLNTLVLSRNPVHDIGDSLMGVKSIRKLSLSHCHIEEIGSSLKACTDLKEARFSHNQITTLPAELASNVKIQILDLGNNVIENLSELKVLSALHNLRNLNLKGNPVTEKDKLNKKIQKLVPNLRTFNGNLIERENMRERISKEIRSHTKNDPSVLNVFDVEVQKKVKQNKSNRDVEAQKEVKKNKSNRDVEAQKEVKKKKSNTEMKTSRANISTNHTEDAQTLPSSTEVEFEKKMKKKQSHKDTDISANQTKGERSTENKSKRKRESEGSKGMDDVETPFMDLILSKYDHEAAPGAELIGELDVDHSKKKKKRVTVVASGEIALQNLPPILEVGMGGQSTWDD